MCVPGVHKDPKRVSDPVAEVTDNLLTTMWVLETKLRFAGGGREQNKTKNQLVLLSTESSQPPFWIIVPMELCVIHCCVSGFFCLALHWWDSPPCCCSHGLFILTSGPCFTLWMCPSLFPHSPLVERQWCLCLGLVWAKQLQPFYTYTPLLIHRYANFPECIPRSGIWDCMIHIGHMIHSLVDTAKHSFKGLWWSAPSAGPLVPQELCCLILMVLFLFLSCSLCTSFGCIIHWPSQTQTQWSWSWDI